MRAYDYPVLMDGIEYWLFDLDNTLYPAQCNLFEQIDQRMGEFIANLLNVDRLEARVIQKQYFRDYGTTLNGLMRVHDLNPDIFLDFVHDIDHSPIGEDAALDQALEALPGRKFIFTNGTVSHAENVTNRLGVTRHFEDVFDIAATGYVPKPHAEAYSVVIERTGLDSGKTAMFEDMARNLEVPFRLGMTTVYVSANGAHPDQSMGLQGLGTEEHIHHVTDHLAGFLGSIVDSRTGG